MVFDPSVRQRDNDLIKIYLLNKKERYEYDLERGRKDGRLEEVEAFLKRINDSKQDMYERKKKHSRL